MAGFLYYKPGVRNNNRVTLAEVRQWGLGYAFEADPLSEKDPQSREVGQNTPDKKNGFVFADESRLGGMAVGNYPEEQVWRQIHGSEIWVGFYREHPPTPTDLARARLLDGYMLPLGGGLDWQVPLVRRFDSDVVNLVDNLPAYYDLDENDKWTRGARIELYNYLWDLTEPYADSLWQSATAEEDEEREVEPESEIDQFDVAVKLLQANYHIDRTESALMHLWSDLHQPASVLALAVDYGTLARWLHDQNQKKSQPEAAGLNT